MVSMNVAGLLPDLIVVADERRNTVVLRPIDGQWAELLARAVTEVFGGSAAMADYVMPVSLAQGTIIVGTVSLALRIGRSVVGVADPVAALTDELGAVRLVEGKVVDVERHTAGGFVRGSVVIEGYGDDAGPTRPDRDPEREPRRLRGRRGAGQRARTSSRWSTARQRTRIATEFFRYGQRLAVLAFACAPIWRTPAGISDRRPPCLRLRRRLRPGGGASCRSGLTCDWVSTSAARTPTPSSSTATTRCSPRRSSPPRSTSPPASARPSLPSSPHRRSRPPASATSCSGRRTRPTPCSNDAGCTRSAVLRVGAPSSTAVRPFFGWPDDLVAAVGGHARIVARGSRVRRSRDRPVRRRGHPAFFESVRGTVDAVAISAVFSPMSADHELAAAEIARDVLGERRHRLAVATRSGRSACSRARTRRSSTPR